MSSLLKNKEFLQLLLKTSIDQALGLLLTLSPQQVRLLCEIALHILHGLFRKVRQISPYKTIIRSLASKSISLAQKKKLIARQRKRVLSWLKIVKSQLETYIQ